MKTIGGAVTNRGGGTRIEKRKGGGRAKKNHAAQVTGVSKKNMELKEEGGR